MASDGVVDNPIRLVLVIDVLLYREGLVATLPQDLMTVVGTASNCSEAIQIIDEAGPEVVLVDVAISGALDLMTEVRTDRPTIQLIALAVDENIDAIVSCAEAGAAAYVSANDGMSHLVKTIMGAVGGELHCSPRIAAELFRRIGDECDVRTLSVSAPETLSNRERQVLTLLQRRLTNKEIAADLNISEATVKNHVHHLLQKLQVPNRVKAADAIPRSSRAYRGTGGERTLHGH